MPQGGHFGGYKTTGYSHTIYDLASPFHLRSILFGNGIAAIACSTTGMLLA
jgi:hypothetical protein